MIHFDSWFGSASDTVCNRGQWRFIVRNSSFQKPKRCRYLQSLLGFVSRCCFFFKSGNSLLNLLSPYLGKYVFSFFFAGHFKDIQNWFHCFCPLFQSAFPFSWHCSLCLFTVFLAFPFDFGAVSPEIQQPDPPAGCVARREKNKWDLRKMRRGDDGECSLESMDQKQGMTTRWGPDYSKQNGGALPFQWPKINSLITGGLNP